MMNSFGSRQSALKKDVETGKWGAAVAAVAATLRERLATAVAAQDRADWATALVALTADRPQEPFPDAFAAEPLLGLLQQLAALEKDIRAGQRAAQVEALLAAARAAKAKKDWSAVMAAADKALALDEDNVEAKALRAEASRHHLRVPEGFASRRARVRSLTRTRAGQGRSFTKRVASNWCTFPPGPSPWEVHMARKVGMVMKAPSTR
jgi:hypothetical protein